MCLFTPLLGVLTPLAAGLANFGQLGIGFFLLALLFFTAAAYLVWRGTVALLAHLRSRRQFRNRLAQKLGLLVLLTLLYGATMGAVSSGCWQLLVFRQLDFVPLLRFAGIMAAVALLLGLVYESVFLSAEIELDTRVMQQLELERLQAESNVLQNELDPHFLFNSLNALSYLVRNDADQAYQFVHKLSNVFKYLLLNKQKDVVTLHEELAYLDDYCFLLKVRFDESIQVEKLIREEDQNALLLPCTLQALVENAIKHNYFSEKEPLRITIRFCDRYVSVTNTLRPKPLKALSSQTGLHHLQTRYNAVMNTPIVVQTTAETILVKVPCKQRPSLRTAG